MAPPPSRRGWCAPSLVCLAVLLLNRPVHVGGSADVEPGMATSFVEYSASSLRVVDGVGEKRIIPVGKAAPVLQQKQQVVPEQKQELAPPSPKPDVSAPPASRTTPATAQPTRASAAPRIVPVGHSGTGDARSASDGPVVAQKTETIAEFARAEPANRAPSRPAARAIPVGGTPAPRRTETPVLPASPPHPQPAQPEVDSHAPRAVVQETADPAGLKPVAPAPKSIALGTETTRQSRIGKVIPVKGALSMRAEAHESSLPPVLPDAYAEDMPKIKKVQGPEKGRIIMIEAPHHTSSTPAPTPAAEGIVDTMFGLKEGEGSPTGATSRSEAVVTATVSVSAQNDGDPPTPQEVRRPLPGPEPRRAAVETQNGADAPKGPEGIPGLVWMGPVLGSSGYGAEARSYGLIMEPLVPDLALRHFGDFQADNILEHMTNTNQSDTIRKLLRANVRIDRSVLLCHSTAIHYHQQDIETGWQSLCPLEGAGATVGRTMYETDSLPPGWVEKLNRMDEVWVPSRWNADTFAKAGVDATKIYVVPEPVDTEVVFNPHRVDSPYPLFVPALSAPWRAPEEQLVQVFSGSFKSFPGGQPARAVEEQMAHAAAEAAAKILLPSPPPAPPLGQVFKFLSMSKWEYRKGFDILLRAYCEEFRHSDSVALYIKTNAFVKNPHGELDSIRTRISEALDIPPDHLPRIAILDEWLKESELPSLYAAVDAFVLPSRGEGWGRPQAEAMSMGLPTITTNWGGTSEFINDEVALPVQVEAMQKLPATAQNELTGRTGKDSGIDSHHYALPSIKHLRSQMRWAYENQEGAKAIGIRARKHMREKYSMAAVGKIVAQLLMDLKPTIQRRQGPEKWLDAAIEDAMSEAEALKPSPSPATPEDAAARRRAADLELAKLMSVKVVPVNLGRH